MENKGKPVLLVCDVTSVPYESFRDTTWFEDHGYDLLVLFIDDQKGDAVKALDIANLPPAEMEEVREIARKSAVAVK